MLEPARIERTPLAVSRNNDTTQPGTPAALQLRIGLIREAALSLLNQLEPLDQEQATNEGEKSSSLYEEVRRFEIQLITNALSQTRGHQKEAARLLGIKATTLNSKIKRYKMVSFARGWSILGHAGSADDRVEGNQEVL